MNRETTLRKLVGGKENREVSQAFIYPCLKLNNQPEDPATECFVACKDSLFVLLYLCSVLNKGAKTLDEDLD